MVVSWDVVVDQIFVDDVVVSEEAASVSLVELKEEDMTDSVVDCTVTTDDASDEKLTKTLSTIKNKNRELTL